MSFFLSEFNVSYFGQAWSRCELPASDVNYSNSHLLSDSISGNICICSRCIFCHDAGNLKPSDRMLNRSVSEKPTKKYPPTLQLLIALHSFQCLFCFIALINSFRALSSDKALTHCNTGLLADKVSNQLFSLVQQAAIKPGVFVSMVIENKSCAERRVNI